MAKEVVAIAATVLVVVAFGQTQSEHTTNSVHMSGRLLDSNDAPITDRTITLRNVTTSGSLQDNKAETDENGIFAFSGERGVVYQINLTVTEDPPVFRGIGTIEVVEGQDLAMGDSILRVSPERDPRIYFAGPIRIRDLLPAPRSIPKSAQVLKATSITAVFIGCSDAPNEFCAGGTVHIISSDGNEARLPAEKEQVGSRSPLISEDKQAVGWLADYGNCCTSYPQSLKLMVYRPGKPAQGFRGDGRAIFDWHFEAGGKQVAFYQDFPHGTPVPHYELRDLQTGRLVDKWDGDLTRQSPAWAKGLGAKASF